MEIADYISDRAEEVAQTEYGKSFEELEDDEQELCIIIAENLVLGV